LRCIRASIFKINYNIFNKPKSNYRKRSPPTTYRTLEVLGPEHEFSIVDEQLRALPIVDRVIKDFHGRIVNFVELPTFTFGKELQLHVMEVKPNEPFRSPKVFEETMQESILTLDDFLERKYQASLLGTGMHPLMRLEDTGIWPHRHRQIYEAMSRIFNLEQHGWLNIQSFQLNLPYGNEEDAVSLHNALAAVCAYLPAIAASSPIYEGKVGENVDNRLQFYATNQREVPSIVGDVVPEYTSSLRQYKREIIEKYSYDLATAGAERYLLHKDWVNSRGMIIRFDRKALEIRVMDEQECVKSDVALSCFIRALTRGLLEEKSDLLPHDVLVKDFKAIIKAGLNAKVSYPNGDTARKICKHMYSTAWKNASDEEKIYLPIILKRIEQGNLSEIINERIKRKAQKTDHKQAIRSIYLRLAKNLRDNQPYF
jgi:gamma-glutamyl:cysteine ligase YbdK (ATP-grasp superfamily)